MLFLGEAGVEQQAVLLVMTPMTAPIPVPAADTSALLAMLGCSGAASATACTLRLLQSLAGAGRFGRSLAPEQQSFLVLPDTVLKQLDSLKAGDPGVGGPVRRFFDKVRLRARMLWPCCACAVAALRQCCAVPALWLHGAWRSVHGAPWVLCRCPVRPGQACMLAVCCCCMPLLRLAVACGCINALGPNTVHVQDLDAAGPKGADFLTVLAAHEGEGLVLDRCAEGLCAEAAATGDSCCLRTMHAHPCSCCARACASMEHA